MYAMFIERGKTYNKINKVIVKAGSFEEADAICKTEPFVVEGYATYKLYAIQSGNRDNNYLL